MRFVARNTQTYAQLLMVAATPRCLMDPLEVDAVLRRLAEQPLRWDEDGQAAASEMRSLWQFDIPRFAAPADGTQLAHDDVLDIGLELRAFRRRGTYGPPRRRDWPRCSRAGAGERMPLRLTTERDVRGDRAGSSSESVPIRCELFEDPARPSHWSNMADDPEPDHIKGSLYYGSADVALFLAYLHAIGPHERWRSAARRALRRAVARPRRHRGRSRACPGR
ncbi:MAG TPA: DUF4135 domain-containing protein, partial [Solirubrobacteraceae bacterium]|nr:DUF4135 domain-containing protein [Solirubrobacteraceae bacterium]